MSSSNNNFTPSSGDRRYIHRQYGLESYAPNNSEWNYPAFPPFSPPRLTLQGRDAYDPWRATEDAVITEPFGFMSFPGRVRPSLQILVLDTLARESAPRLLGQRNLQASTSTQEDSRLSREEQGMALKKLRKEMYNPMPKRLSSRLCLYYRDQAANIVNERAREKEEDGKRCAVCLEDFEPREMVMVTPCNHMFHEECIVPWVKSHGQCPVCRSTLGDRMTGSSAGAFNDNNFPTLAPNDNLLAPDLISILRAMGGI